MTQPFIKVQLAGAALLGAVAAALTIAPSSRDFGDVAVLGRATYDFVATVSSLPATLEHTIMGPDALHFGPSGRTTLSVSLANGCALGSGGVAECRIQVEFHPLSPGPKTATLVVTDNGGNRATAALKGNGVGTPCTHTVVPCNYAHHYSGVVSWTDGTAGVNVDVVKGVASCNATGESELTSGPGLVAVEFDRSDEAPSPFYRITVACPTRYPPEPARPAELGHGELGSYKQPLGMPIEDVHKRPPRLKGQDGEVSWNLCPNAQYVRAVRQGPNAAVGPHDPCP